MKKITKIILGVLAIILSICGITAGVHFASSTGSTNSNGSTGATNSTWSDISVDHYGCPNSKRVGKLIVKKKKARI